MHCSTSSRRARTRRRSCRSTESLPTPVRRLPHEGDTDDPARRDRRGPPRRPPGDRPPSARQARRQRTSGHAPKGRRRQAGPGKSRRQAVIGQDAPPPTDDHRLRSRAVARDAVPDEVVARLRARARGARRRPREPRRGHAGCDARASAGSSRPSAAARPRCSPTRRRRPTRSCPDVDRIRPDPDPGRRLRPAGAVRLRTAERVGAVRDPPPGAVPRRAADRHRPPRLQRRPGAGGLGRPGRRRDLRDGRAARGPARRAARRRRRRAGDRADGRDRHGHRDLRPSQRDAAHARGRRRRSSRPARRCPTSRAGSTARSPTRSSGCSGACWPASGVARRTDHLVDAARPEDLEATGALPAHSEGIIDLLAQSETAEVAMLLKEQDDGTTRLSACARSPGGVDATVLTGDVRRRRATRGPPAPRSRCRSTRRSSRWTRRPPAGRGRAAGEPRRGGRGGLDGVLVVAKPSGPTSHDVVGLVRRLSSTRRVGHGGTLDPFAAGVLPRVPGAGDAARRVPPRADEALPGDDLLRRAVDDGRHRRRADARGRARRSRASRGGGAGRVHRPDQPGPARLQRGPDRGPAGVPAGALRASPWSSPRATSRSTPSTSSSGTAATRRGRWRSSTSVLRGDVHPGARAGPRRARSGTGAYLGALVRTASGGFRLEDAVALDDLREARRRTARRASPRAAPDRRRARGPAPRGRHRRRDPAPRGGPDHRSEDARSRIRDAPIVLAVGPRREGRGGVRRRRGRAVPAQGAHRAPADPRATAAHGAAPAEPVPRAPEPCASSPASTRSSRVGAPAFVVVGVFDGLHLGHAYLLEHLVREAGRAVARPVVITFDHHPDEVLTGQRAAAPVRPGRADRAARGGRRRHDGRRALRPGPARDAVRRVRRPRSPPRTPLAGFLMTPDAAFGYQRAGHARGARRAGRRTRVRDVVVVPAFEVDGRAVSSTQIRSAIAAGRPRAAAGLLGRPHAVVGEATRERARGACSGSRSPSPCLRKPDTGWASGRVHPVPWPRRRPTSRTRSSGSRATDGRAAPGWRSSTGPDREPGGL